MELLSAQLYGQIVVRTISDFSPYGRNGHSTRGRAGDYSEPSLNPEHTTACAGDRSELLGASPRRYNNRWVGPARILNKSMKVRSRSLPQNCKSIVSYLVRLVAQISMVHLQVVSVHPIVSMEVPLLSIECGLKGVATLGKRPLLQHLESVHDIA